MRVALLAANAQSGDALGAQLAEKLAFFLERGADVRVFLDADQRLDPRVCPYLQKREPGGALDSFLASADLVIADYGQYYPLLDQLPLLAGGKARVVLDYHGVTPPQLWGAHNREGLDQGEQQRGLVWCADAALCHSQFTSRELSAPTGFPADRLYRAGYPLDTGWFCPGAPTRALRAELGLEQATLLLYVGRLAANKRLPVLVEALDRLRERTPAVHALLIGDDQDVYQDEAERCRRRAGELGVADRLHILGHVTAERLRDAYRCADLFVTPSRHEGFCLPVLEAMACGLPVIAARAGALTETVGNAGLSFRPDDADDLARQVRRILDYSARNADRAVSNVGRSALGASRAALLRVAVVACRYGSDFVGGAETSLRTIAESLALGGHAVEVFTTCLQDEDDWTGRLAEGTEQLNGIAIHRFRLDATDRVRHQAAQRLIEENGGAVPIETQRDYLEQSVRSRGLLEALQQRIDEIDAVIVGPYLFGLTFDVARACPEKVLLLPCFHDEATARLEILRDAYSQVGGILYHSREEQALAEIDLGLNHPGAVCSGTLVDVTTTGAAGRGRERVSTSRRYVLYGGRYSPHKNLPVLLEYAQRYAAIHPERFTFAFVGQGELSLPEAPWLRDLGFVSAADRRDVVAGAAAVVQLSRLESLSLVALEAWAQGTPVLADAACPVLAAHIKHSQGGRAVAGYDEFAAALDDLWEQPGQWQTLGQQGRAYVRANYGERAPFVARLEAAIRDLALPLAERMRQRGRDRAAQYSRPAWREQFALLVEEWLDAPARVFKEKIEVQPRATSRSVSAGLETMLLPVRVVNRGSHAVAAVGLTHIVIRCRVIAGAGEVVAKPFDTPLPALLLPKRAMPVAVLIPVPSGPGEYQIILRAERPGAGGAGLPARFQSVVSAEAQVRLIVEARSAVAFSGALPAEGVEAALVAAQRASQLPEDYADVTQGWFAIWKKRIKQKLLNNFKRAYVDVLARQQSAFNRHVLTALHELVESDALLHHAVQQTAVDPQLEEVRKQLAASQRRCAALEERLVRLESQVPQEEVSS